MDLASAGSDIERVIVTQEQIHNRLAELALQVEKDYEGREVLLIGILKGAAEGRTLVACARGPR